MSIMDFFASQGTAVPSTGSSGGDWKDWFLDMKGREPLGDGIAYPDPEAERGDWIDWYLNREGPAGRFKGSRRPRYGIDYLFNGGGSVQSEPSYSSVQSGPRTRQKLQPRSADVLGNVSDRYYREGNVEGIKRMNQELQNRLQNHPSFQPGTGTIFNTSPIEGGPVDPGSFWNVGLQPGTNTGIMSAMTDYSPDARGTWITKSPKGNKLLSFLVNQLGSEESANWLKDKGIGGDGFSAFGANWTPNIEMGDDGWGAGITGTWNLQNLFGKN